ncbi:MAG: hypothetical protein BRC22_00450, partial [Parcubacteria group bacterium QH_9_35_7]
MSLAPKLESFLKEQLPKNCKTTIYSDPLNKENLEENTEILGVFTDSKINSDIFSALHNLKLIVVLATGFDNVELEPTKQKDIPVCNVPKYGNDTVSEYTIGLIISLLRKIPEAIDSVRSGEFTYRGLRGTELYKKTVGVIGTGDIGERVIKKLSNFGVDFLAFDPYKKEKLEEKYDLKYCDKQKVVENSDIITLHCPLMEKTKYTIDEKELSQMKETAFLINTARGALIRSEALLKALQDGEIAGAALDVMEEENILSDPKTLYQKNFNQEDIEKTLYSELIIDHPNTIVTPHNAF